MLGSGMDGDGRRRARRPREARYGAMKPRRAERSVAALVWNRLDGEKVGRRRRKAVDHRRA